MEIIPAIDIIDGRCVRLTKGDYATQKVYNADPVEVAKAYQDAGLRRLHVVDLDGAKAGHIINHKTLTDICSRTSLIVDFGGGLKTADDLRIAFECGANMVTGGSIAIKKTQEFTSWIQQYGPERIILGADARDGKIAVTGWTETSSQDLIPFIASYRQKGITKVICTDISRDGTLQGPALQLYSDIMSQVDGIQLIASGGVSSIDDLEALEQAGIPAAIIGKAIYEKRVTLQQLRPFID